VLVLLPKAFKPVDGYTVESVTPGHWPVTHGYLPKPKSTATAFWFELIISNPAEGRRLSLLGWLVTYQDSLPYVLYGIWHQYSAEI